MKYKNDELIGISNGITALESNEGIELPIILGWKFSVIQKKIQPFIEVLEASRMAAIQKHLPEGQDTLTKDNPAFEEALHEIASLLASEIEVDIEKIPLYELLEIKGQSKNIVSIMNALGPVIDGDKEIRP